MVAALVRDDVLVSSLIGQPVVNEVGEKIGDVDDLIMDKQGHVSAALVEVGGFIGVEEKLVAVPFSSLSSRRPASPALSPNFPGRTWQRHPYSRRQDRRL